MVSIISPCYNGEHYVGRFIESVLAQDYPSIELILIDDGSTDYTKNAILKYEKTFTQRGYQLHYIHQEHTGQAEAINKGLKVFHGGYLTWFDSDDMMTPDSLSKRVHFLEAHPEYGFCCCRVQFVDENDYDHVSFEWGNIPTKSKETFFENIMFCHHALFSDGYLVPSGNFLKLFPDRHIYPSTEGQNWQLLLPLAYNLPCGFMDECLVKVVERTGSHSRMHRTPREKMARYQGLCDILLHVLNEVRPRKYEEYVRKIKIEYAKDRLRIAPKCNNAKLAREIYQVLQEQNAVTSSDRLYYYASTNAIGYLLLTGLLIPRKGFQFMKHSVKRCLQVVGILPND